MHYPYTRPLLAVLLSGLALLGPGEMAEAQNVTLDQGTFRLSVDGREVGTENFTIVQSGSDADVVIVAQGEAAIDTSGTPDELRAMVRVVGPEMRPAAYEVVAEGEASRRISGRMSRNRFSATIRSDRGEERREYLASDDAIVVDDGITHHHYFLARRHDGGADQVPVIIPRRSRQISVAITDSGEQTLEIGGQSVPARTLSLRADGGEERRLWVDARGRVLQLEIPERGYTARRTAPPR